MLFFHPRGSAVASSWSSSFAFVLHEVHSEEKEEALKPVIEIILENGILVAKKKKVIFQ